MLPVTRANLDNICCTCLVNLSKQKAYDVKKESNLLNMLKLTAFMDVVKNPSDLEYVNDYCKKVCDVCFLNVKKAFEFREKFIISRDNLKELLKNESKAEIECYCRICLSRQHFSHNNKQINNTNLKLIESCLGLRKEDTNEIASASHRPIPKQICENCLEELQNIEELQLLSKCSYEHIVSEISKTNSVPLKGKPNDILPHQETSLTYNKTQPTYGSEKRFVLNFEDDSQCQKTSYDAPLQNNIDLKGPQDAEGTNISLNEKDNSGVVLKTYKDKQNVPEIIKANNDVFVLKYEEGDTKYHEPVCNSVTIQKNIVSRDLPSKENIDAINASVNEDNYSTATLKIYTDEGNVSEIIKANNEVFVIKYEEEDTQYQEQMYNNVSPQENIVLKDSQIDKSNTDSSKILVNENDCTVPFEGDDSRGKGLEMDIVDADEDIKVSEYHTQKAKLGDLAEQSPPEKHNQSKKGKTGARKRFFTCQICSKHFTTNPTLKRHIFAVHEKQKPFCCSYCPRTFALDFARKAHELVHSGEYPFVCKWCQKGFRASSHLKVHEEIHTKLQELLCHICKRAQKSKEELENHLKAHRLPCSSCGRKFKFNRNLKEHENMCHLNLRPYKCSFCDKSYASYRSKHKHEKVHKQGRQK